MPASPRAAPYSLKRRAASVRRRKLSRNSGFDATHINFCPSTISHSAGMHTTNNHYIAKQMSPCAYERAELPTSTQKKLHKLPSSVSCVLHLLCRGFAFSAQSKCAHMGAQASQTNTYNVAEPSYLRAQASTAPESLSQTAPACLTSSVLPCCHASSTAYDHPTLLCSISSVQPLLQPLPKLASQVRRAALLLCKTPYYSQSQVQSSLRWPQKRGSSILKKRSTTCVKQTWLWPAACKSTPLGTCQARLQSQTVNHQRAARVCLLWRAWRWVGHILLN